MYKAIVTKIHTRPLPGADNLVIGACRGYQVLVNNATPDGALGVFFEQGGQLSEEFVRQHDLVRRKDENGKAAGGFFEENRRVRALKLRGARSDGFWCPLSHLNYTGYDTRLLKDGDQFDELNEHPICNKYVTRATARSGRQKPGRSETPMFRLHIETEAFKRGVGQIPAGALIYITEKIHGTSFRYGHVLDTAPAKLGWWSRLFHRVTRRQPPETRAWTHLNGSRNVVLEKRTGEGFYGAEGFRIAATSGIRLRKGEVIYGELVGYTETGQPIMAPQDTRKLKDKAIKSAYGDQMTYRYGTIPGQCDLYVYRITLANEDGEIVELPWLQVLQRCRELGLKPVPALASGYHLDTDALIDWVNGLTESTTGTPHPSTLDESHIREGVVVRYESEHGTGWLKNKSFTFGVLEGYLKESDDYIDTEEAS